MRFSFFRLRDERLSLSEIFSLRPREIQREESYADLLGKPVEELKSLECEKTKPLSLLRKA